jgi:hypothetical protein
MQSDDPSLLVDCRSTPRRPLTDPDLTHDWTPQHYPSGAIGGYYCPDCLIAGAPTSTLCPDRVAHVVAEVRRLTDANQHLERLAAAWKLTAEQTEDEARAALAAARVDGARGMRDRFGAECDAHVLHAGTRAKELRASNFPDAASRLDAQANMAHALGEIVRSWDPATVGSGS